MGMGSLDIRVAISVLCIVLFLLGYSYLLLDAITSQIQPDEMTAYLVKMDMKKLLNYSQEKLKI